MELRVLVGYDKNSEIFLIKLQCTSISGNTVEI